MKNAHRSAIVVADLLIVVAASALGMAVLRATAESSGGGYLRHVPAPHSHWNAPLGSALPFYYFLTLYNAVPQIIVAALCAVALSIRAWWTSNLRLARRTGFVLCLVATAAAALTVAVDGLALHWNGYYPNWRIVVERLIPNAGCSVLGAWAAMAFVGRGRPAPLLVDRVGFGLAVSLVVLLVLEKVRLLLEAARVV